MTRRQGKLTRTLEDAGLVENDMQLTGEFKRHECRDAFPRLSGTAKLYEHLGSTPRNFGDFGVFRKVTAEGTKVR